MPGVQVGCAGDGCEMAFSSHAAGTACFSFVSSRCANAVMEQKNRCLFSVVVCKQMLCNASALICFVHTSMLWRLIHEHVRLNPFSTHPALSFTSPLGAALGLRRYASAHTA